MNATRRITAGALSALCLAAFGGCSNSSKVLVLVPENDSGGGSAVSAGLYKGNEASGAPLAKITGLGDALERIKELGNPAAVYTVVLDTGETLAPQTLSAADYGARITLKGVNSAVTLQLSGSTQGSLFTVTGASAEAPFTLALGNITLKGIDSNTAALVTVDAYGILDAGAGAVITGNTNTVGEGGGVCVSANGKLILSGGAVTGNTVQWNTTDESDMPSGGGVSVTNGAFELTAGAVSGNSVINTASDSGGARGGGVTVLGAASFTMEGGSVDHNTITGSRQTVFGVSGGGLYIEVSGNSVDIRGGNVSYNSAISTQVAVGGGILFRGKLLNIGDTESTKAVSVDHNTAKGEDTSTSFAGAGGGIFVAIYTGALHLMGNTAVTENAAEGPEGSTQQGGGIYVYKSVTLSGNASVTGNRPNDVHGTVTRL
jgi:hypothetical protein